MFNAEEKTAGRREWAIRATQGNFTIEIMCDVITMTPEILRILGYVHSRAARLICA